MKTTRKRALAAVGGALGLLVCCNVYEPGLLEGEKRPPKDGVGFWSGPGDRGCFSARTPRPTDRPSPKGDKDVGPIVLAIQSMRLGSMNERGEVDPEAWKKLGFDLDGRCTGSDSCPGTDSPPSCVPPIDQIPIPLDGELCRDNTFGRLEHTATIIPETAKKYGLSDDAFNCALCVGAYNFVIRISGYNGEPDDDRVRVDLYPSPGLEAILPWDCATGEWHDHPCWTSNLPWTIQDDGVQEKRGGPNLPDAKIFDDNAYVREGYVVMTIPDGANFWFPGYNGLVTAFPLRVQKGLVTGKISLGSDKVWRISDGMIGGRVKAADVVQGFRLIGFCEQDSNYKLMKDFVGNNQDVLADGRTDPAATCDAMSFGVGFVALQATAGKLATVEPLTECQLRGKAAKDAGAD